MNRSVTSTVASLLAAGALVVPVAEAAKPPFDPNDIPDPSTVPDATPRPASATVDPPSPGEPPDAEDEDEDPFVTPYSPPWRW